MHFLDVKIHQNSTDIYYKDMRTRQCINYCSQTPCIKAFDKRTSWINALYHRAQNICSNKQALDKQSSQIKTFMSWNGYSKRVQNSVIKQIETKKITLKINR